MGADRVQSLIEFLFREGVAHQTQGRLDLARSCYDRILADWPGQPDAMHLKGVVAHQQGRHDEAAGLIRRAIVAKPFVADYHSNLGDALHASGALPDALAAYRMALSLAADNPRIHNKAGVVLRDLRRSEEALACFVEATRLDRLYAIALSNLGVTARDLRLFDHAEKALRRVVELAPNDPGGYNNLGSVFGDLGRLAEAEARYRRSLELDPNNRVTAYNLACILLCAGRFAEAWPLFEARWHVGGHRPRALDWPRWAGEPGIRLLLHAEQGLGDTIQFLRFVAPAVAAVGPEGRVIVEAQASLRPLIEAQGWDIDVVPRHADLPPFDREAALMSLPGILAGGAASGFSPDPYLQADPTRTAAWTARLSALPGRRVGLVWAGNPDYEHDRFRSVPLSMLAPLAALPGVSFVNLQVGARPAGNGPKLHDWTAELTDFAETAALVSALDLVISVDTAVAHLAGALGKPVWLLNRFDCCWRWMRGTEDSVWYGGLRQFRQTAPDDWAGVIGRVRRALIERTA